MANEFVARNGVIALNNSQVTGSLSVSNGITGSLFGTASYATQALSASYATQALSASYAPGGSGTPAFPYTGSAQITGSLGVTGSINATSITGSLFGTSSYATTASYWSGSILNATSASYAATASLLLGSVVSASYPTTASYANNFTVAGTLTAQTIVVQTITASQEYSSGSNIFGNLLTNTQQLTGSVSITGSLTLRGNEIITGSSTATLGYTGSLLGTASYATQALSASYAPVFPYTGNAVITGNTIITGSFAVYTGSLTLAPSQSGILFNQVLSQSSAATGSSGSIIYGVNITPTFINYNTTSSQIQTAFRVLANFTGSQSGSSVTNRIVDFGSVGAGSQLVITERTSGSIFTVNDVSGLPIIEARSDWTVNLYNYPNIVLQKTGSRISISGSLVVSGSIAGGGATPTLVTGSGLGTGASGSIRGFNNGGIITFVVGSSPVANAGLAVVTYTSAFPNGSSIVLFPANASGSTMPTSSIFVSGSTTNFTVSSSTVALRASVTASWNYIVMGF